MERLERSLRSTGDLRDKDRADIIRAMRKSRRSDIPLDYNPLGEIPKAKVDQTTLLEKQKAGEPSPLSVSGAANLVGVNRSTILRYIKNGEISSTRIGRQDYNDQYLIPASELTRFTGDPGNLESSIETKAFSLAETANLFGVRRETIWRWLKAGKIHGHRVGIRNYRIPTSEIQRLLDSRE